MPGKRLDLPWNVVFLATRRNAEGLERTRDAIRDAIAYHAFQAASVIDGIDVKSVETCVRERIGWSAEPQPDESILTAAHLLIAFQSHIDGNASCNGLLREYARQYVADKSKGREPRRTVWRKLRARILRALSGR